MFRRLGGTQSWSGRCEEKKIATRYTDYTSTAPFISIDYAFKWETVDCSMLGQVITDYNSAHCYLIVPCWDTPEHTLWAQIKHVDMAVVMSMADDRDGDKHWTVTPFSHD
jgi:hypothetical protein